MNKSALRSLALGFFLSAAIVFTYTTFFYKAPVADTTVTVEPKKDDTVTNVDYKEKYEELLAKTELENTKVDNQTDTKKDEGSQPKEAEKKPDESKDTSNGKKEYNLVIESGAPSSVAIDKLADNGIIKSSEEFTKFLSDNDYETLVRDGSYELNSDMTNEEIAKIITHSN